MHGSVLFSWFKGKWKGQPPWLGSKSLFCSLPEFLDFLRVMFGPVEWQPKSLGLLANLFKSTRDLTKRVPARAVVLAKVRSSPKQIPIYEMRCFFEYPVLAAYQILRFWPCIETQGSYLKILDFCCRSAFEHIHSNSTGSLKDSVFACPAALLDECCNNMFLLWMMEWSKTHGNPGLVKQLEDKSGYV